MAFDSIESYESSKRNDLWKRDNNIIEEFANSFEFDLEGTDAGWWYTGTLLYLTDNCEWQFTHRCDNVPQPVVVHSRPPLPRLPTILLGNHILVKFNFVIIAEGRESLARGDVVAWDIKRYVEIVLSLVFMSGNDTALSRRAKCRETAVSYFLFTFAHGWLYRERSINFRVLASTTSTTAMTSTGIPQDDSPLSWFFTSKSAQIDRDIDIDIEATIRVYSTEPTRPQKLVTLRRLVVAKHSKSGWTSSAGR